MNREEIEQKIIMNKLRKIKLRMLSTKHNIDKDSFVREGYINSRYEVGNDFRLVDENRDPAFCSTPIIEIIDNKTFKTHNTTYEIEEIYE